MSHSLPAPQRSASNTETPQHGRLWIIVTGLVVATAAWLGANTNTIFNGLLALFTYLLYKVSKRKADIADGLADVSV